MNQRSIFWTAFWAGIASPVAVYAPPPPYAAYANNFTVADSFAQVGASLNNALAAIAHDPKFTAPSDDNRPVAG